MTNLVVMEKHLELVEVEPALGLPGLEVVVEVPRRKAEGVELLVRGEEENCRRLLVVDTCHHHCHRHPIPRMINKIYYLTLMTSMYTIFTIFPPQVGAFNKEKPLRILCII